MTANVLAHTPGPWIFESTESAKRDVEAQLPDACSFWIAGQDGVGEVTALVIETSRKEAEANARLIAAAPDLLTALQGINECACYTQENASPLTREAMLQEIGRLARAAIEKAEGQA